MPGVYRYVFVIFALLGLTVAGCSDNLNRISIAEIYLASDGNGSNRTTVFTPADTFFCIVNLDHAPKDTVVKAAWYTVDTGDGGTKTLIDDYVLKTGAALLPFMLTSNSPWPAGFYRVEISLNGEVKQTLDFSVQ